jgi:Na+-driven multidrug efflux pump
MVSTATMLTFTLLWLALKVRIYANPIAPLHTILQSWRHMLQIGIPAMVTNAIIPVSSGIVVAMIATFGVDAVAGFGVAMRIEPMFLIPCYALSAVSSPFFGQNFGAGHFDRLLEARRVVARFCLALGLGLFLMLLAGPALTGLFSESAPSRRGHPLPVDHLHFWAPTASSCPATPPSTAWPAPPGVVVPPAA